MTKTLNFKKMGRELLEIYQLFVSNPTDKICRQQAIAFERKYAGLGAYNDILKEPPVPAQIQKALGNLSRIYQYGYGIFDDKESIKATEETIKELEKFVV